MLKINKRCCVILLLASALFLFYGCTKEEKGKNYEPSKPEEQLHKKEEFKKEASEKTIVSDKKAEAQSEIKVTFIELGSVKCIPCKMMQPIMKEIEEEYGDQVKVVFYDVWTTEGKPYAQKYGIRVIPTQVFLDKDEKEYFRHTGFFSKEEIVKVLRKKGVE